MEMDDKMKSTLALEIPQEDTNQVQIMEEEPESIDLHGLDIIELELCCQKQAFEIISDADIEKLEGVISRAFHQHQLGIQSGGTWVDNQRPKDSKKRGRKTDLQRTIAIGKILVDSGRYAKLTKYYKPTQNS